MVSKEATNFEVAHIELVIALESLLRAFSTLMPMAMKDKTRERLIVASACGDAFEDVRKAVKNVSRIMREITWELTGDVTDLNGIIRRVEELGSIAHIARSYPDKAIARAKACGRTYLSTFKPTPKASPAWSKY